MWRRARRKLRLSAVGSRRGVRARTITARSHVGRPRCLASAPVAPAPCRRLFREVTTVLSSKLRTGALGAATAVAAAGTVGVSALVWADPPDAPHLSHVPSANQKAAGYPPASRLS